MAAEHAPHRRRPDPDAELGQLALNTRTALAAVLPAQAYDQLDHLGAHRWPSRASLAPPCPLFRAPGSSVPTEQRRGRNQESSPAFPREQPAERSQEGAVNGPVPDAAVDLALKDPDLVTEDDQLDILVGFASSGRHDERQNPAQPEVNERKGHSSMMTGICANCQLKALIEIVAPFSCRPDTSGRVLSAFVSKEVTGSEKRSFVCIVALCGPHEEAIAIGATPWRRGPWPHGGRRRPASPPQDHHKLIAGQARTRERTVGDGQTGPLTRRKYNAQDF